MSDNPEKKDGAAAAPPKAKGGGAAVIVGILLPGLLSGAGAFGGVRVAAAKLQHAAPAGEHAEAHEEPKPKHPRPPGPTIPLDAFLVTIPDVNKKAHPMKLTIAIEFESAAKEDEVKPFIPRIRDSILAHVRTLTWEAALDQEHSLKLREELLERCHKAGAVQAERVLITDLVSQ